ncbi:LIM domain only protein 7-like isoform X2 [Engraulis encrasicolus]|uniref:LIM domain only protein 7-like isoform X2 n=1 Tax=Engraulis encrasicolus TaxID=184585 RepID=UPI002FD73B11
MDNRDPKYRRSLVVTPRVSTQFNQFLPTKDKPSGYVPAPHHKPAEQEEDGGRDWGNPVSSRKNMMYRSKSMADIPMDPQQQQQRYERLQSVRLQMKESDDQWQNDLTEWKNRRKSVNVDLVRKKEEREKIDQITSGTETKTLEERKERPEVQRNKFGRSHYFSYDDSDLWGRKTVGDYKNTASDDVFKTSQVSRDYKNTASDDVFKTSQVARDYKNTASDDVFKTSQVSRDYKNTASDDVFKTSQVSRDYKNAASDDVFKTSRVPEQSSSPSEALTSSQATPSSLTRGSNPPAVTSLKNSSNAPSQTLVDVPSSAGSDPEEALSSSGDSSPTSSTPPPVFDHRTQIEEVRSSTKEEEHVWESHSTSTAVSDFARHPSPFDRASEEGHHSPGSSNSSPGTTPVTRTPVFDHTQNAEVLNSPKNEPSWRSWSNINTSAESEQPRRQVERAEEEDDHSSVTSSSPTSSPVPTFDHTPAVQSSLKEPLWKSSASINPPADQPKQLLEKASVDLNAAVFGRTPAVQSSLTEPLWKSSTSINPPVAQPRRLLEKTSVDPNAADFKKPSVSSIAPTPFQRSNTTGWLSTMVTPRPYGSQSSGRSTLTRIFSVDKITKKDTAQPSAGEGNQHQTEKAPDVNDFGFRRSHSLYDSRLTSTLSEGKKQEEKRRNFEEYHHYQEENQEKQRPNQTEEPWGHRENRNHDVKIAEEKQRAVQSIQSALQHLEVKTNPPEEESEEDTTAEDGNRILLTWQPRTESQSIPAPSEPERPMGKVTKPGGMTAWFLGEESKKESQRAALAELEADRRNIVSTSRYSKAEKVVSSSEEEEDPKYGFRSEMNYEQSLPNTERNSGLSDRSWMRQQVSQEPDHSSDQIASASNARLNLVDQKLELKSE